MADTTPSLSNTLTGTSGAFKSVRRHHVSVHTGAMLLLILCFALWVAGMQRLRPQASLVPRPAQEDASVRPPTMHSQAASTNVDIQGSQSSSSAPSNSSSKTSDASSAQAPYSTSVNVNGQAVPLPSDGNGTVHREITSESGDKTTVDINMDLHSSSTGSSSVNLNIESESKQSSINNSE